MSSGIIHDATIRVGRYSQYSVGRPWASGREGITAPICYAHTGWREDAGEGSGASPNYEPAFPPLAEVIERVVAAGLRSEWPELREATLSLLRADPWAAPRWDDGHDWTMGAYAAAYFCLGTERAAKGLLAEPAFREVWERRIREAS